MALAADEPDHAPPDAVGYGQILVFEQRLRQREQELGEALARIASLEAALRKQVPPEPERT
jgi:hypothetical protein